MNRSGWTRTLIASGVAGIGLTFGGVGLASAADNSSDQPRIQMHGPADGALADELGVTDQQLQDAFEAIHDDVAPPKPTDGARPAPPTDEQIAAHEAELAAALADELGIDEDTVAAALEKVHAEARADGRDHLSDRLDAAVGDGDLTAADKASVLKAYDAGVLAGGPGARH